VCACLEIEDLSMLSDNVVYCPVIETQQIKQIRSRFRKKYQKNILMRNFFLKFKMNFFRMTYTLTNLSKFVMYSYFINFAFFGLRL